MFCSRSKGRPDMRKKSMNLGRIRGGREKRYPEEVNQPGSTRYQMLRVHFPAVERVAGHVYRKTRKHLRACPRRDRTELVV